MREHRVTDRGITTTETGAADAPTLVMVHGSLDRQATFAKLSTQVVGTHRVIVYDRRGYARSRHLGGPYTIDAHVDDLLSVVGDRQVLIYGHSLGGTIALTFAERHPDRVRGLAVYETPMSWLPFWIVPGGVTASLDEGGDSGDIAEGFMKRMIGERRWNSLPEATRQMRREEGDTLIGDLMDLRRGSPYDLTRVVCPVLSVVGEPAHERFQKSARIIVEQCPDSRLLSVREWRHNAHVSHPEDFAKSVLRPLFARVESGVWSS